MLVPSDSAVGNTYTYPSALMQVHSWKLRNETRRWTLHGAWIKVLEYDELEGANTDNTIEKLSICFQYWT